MTATEWILKVVLFGIVHWVLAAITLRDLAFRAEVVGGRKWAWAIGIVIVTCLGSLIYMAFHPQILDPGYRDENRHNKGGK